MGRVKLYTVASLLAGLLLAVAMPACLAYANPYSAGQLRHPGVFGVQALPYCVCAVLWLPRRSAAAAKFALGLSLLLLSAAAVLFVLVLVDAAALRSDMVPLFFAGISYVTTVAVGVISAVASIVIARRSPSVGKT